MKRSCLALLLGTLIGSVAFADEWTSLYDGKSLDGWHVAAGKATYTPTPDGIVGETMVGTPNSFLATDDEYGDFELEYEVRMEKGKTFNSGVQFRSAVRDEDGKPRVWGYQCELDPTPRAWSAGIYEEAARGWLYPVSLNPLAQTLFKEGEWNQYRIQACGNELRTWLNGRPVAHVVDDGRAAGFIALQVHDIKDAAMAGRKVTWRNLRIRTITCDDLKPCPVPFVRNTVVNGVSTDEVAQGWKLLWNGRDTDGWRSAKGPDFPKGGWVIKDGVLSVVESGGKESESGGDIITKKSFSRFEVQLEFQITPGANSGIKYLVQPELNKAGGSAIGLEFQILDDELHPDAKLGRDGNRTVGSLYDLITAAADKPKVKPGEWHHARVVANGAKVEHWLDGRLVVSYERDTPAFRALVAESKYKVWPGFGEWASGPILLQDHGNAVSFRSIKVRELSN